MFGPMLEGFCPKCIARAMALVGEIFSGKWKTDLADLKLLCPTEAIALLVRARNKQSAHAAYDFLYEQGVILCTRK